MYVRKNETMTNTNIRNLIKSQTEFAEYVEYEKYGHIKVKLAEMMDRKGITRYRLRALTGLKYDTIDRYYKAKNIAYVDLDFFSKVCFVLNCQLEDLLEYQLPENSAQ